MRALILILTSLLFSFQAVADSWKFDFSRRQKDMIELEKQQRQIASEEKTVLGMITERQGPMQDIVIINTPSGFLPAQIPIKRNQRYRVHVVNVNKDKKNISFMMDDFSQHHGTFFGEEVVFEIEPRKEGLFSFLCPETGAKGKMVVYATDVPIESPLESIRLRRPASE